MPDHAIVLDCDPGQDDALAILLALAAPDAMETIAITTVGGNVPLPLTSRNARAVVELAGVTPPPVHAGCPGPMLKALETAEYVHGESGLNGVVLPEPSLPQEAEHGVDAIVRILMDRPERSVTLVAIGPLTNIALAMIKVPAIIPRIREIVLMGGAVGLGNATPAAEFNIYVDPHAAAVVFQAGVPLVMFGLDVTHQALVTEARLQRFKDLGGRIGPACHGMLEFFNRFDSDRYAAPGAPLHDPCTIAWLLRPDLFAGKHCHVAVETEGRLCAGRTVVDWWPREPRPANALVLDRVDADGLFDLLIERLARLA